MASYLHFSRGASHARRGMPPPHEAVSSTPTPSSQLGGGSVIRFAAIIQRLPDFMSESCVLGWFAYPTFGERQSANACQNRDSHPFKSPDLHTGMSRQRNAIHSPVDGSFCGDLPARRPCFSQVHFVCLGVGWFPSCLSTPRPSLCCRSRSPALAFILSRCLSLGCSYPPIRSASSPFFRPAFAS